MSFPVLQRMDRKRPEMIQPISWQAEAMKGLAQGVQQGMQMVALTQQMKLQSAANDREEMLNHARMGVMQEEARKLKQQNDVRSNLSQLFGLKTQDEVMNNTFAIAQRTNMLTAAYAEGMNHAGRPGPWREQSTLPDLLRSGQLHQWAVEKQQDLGRLADEMTPLGDRMAVMEKWESRLAPIKDQLHEATMAIEQAKSVDVKAPFEGQIHALSTSNFDAGWAQTPITVVVEDRNVGQLAFMHGIKNPKDKDGNELSLDQAQSQRKPVQVPLQQLIGAAKRGEMVEDLAIAIAGSTDSTIDPLMKRLKRDNALGSVERLSELQVMVDEKRGKVTPLPAGDEAQPGDEVIDPTGQRPFLVSEDPKARTTARPADSARERVAGVVDGVEVTVAPSETIMDSLSSGFNTFKSWLVDKMDSNTETDILNEIGGLAEQAAKREATPEQRLLARYSFMRKELDAMRSLQAEMAADPSKRYDSNKYAGVVRSLAEAVARIERQSDIKLVVDKDLERQRIRDAVISGEMTKEQAIAEAERLNL